MLSAIGLSQQRVEVGSKTLEQLEAEALYSEESGSDNEAMAANFTELEEGLNKCISKIKKAAKSSRVVKNGESKNGIEQSVEELVDYYERREQMHKMDKETLRFDMQKATQVIGLLPAVAEVPLKGLVRKEVFTHTPIQWCDEKYPKTGLLQVIEKKDERIQKIRAKGFKYKWQAQFAYFLILFTHLCRTFPKQTLFLFEQILFPVAKEFSHGTSRWAIVGRYALAIHFGGYYALKAGLPAALIKIKEISPFN